MIIIDGEATRNPIFVLLEITWLCNEPCELGEDDPCVSIHVSNCPKGNLDCRKKSERIHSVFLTREEAEVFGKGQKHNLGEKGEGWEVWCIPAEGYLAEILNKYRICSRRRCDQ